MPRHIDIVRKDRITSHQPDEQPGIRVGARENDAVKETNIAPEPEKDMPAKSTEKLVEKNDRTAESKETKKDDSRVSPLFMGILVLAIVAMIAYIAYLVLTQTAT